MKLYFFIFLFLISRNYKRLFRSIPNTYGDYLLLIAHPDDESMFFGPTLLNLNGKVRILCLSKGDTIFKFDFERENELKSLCKKYNWDLKMYNFIDNESWDTRTITNILQYYYFLYPFKTLITFDSGGVSGHKNHISCFLAAKEFSKMFKVKTMYLKSLNTFQKYICNYRRTKNEFVLGFKDYFSVIKMMRYHKSQLLWFRYLYLIFSSYTSYNSY